MGCELIRFDNISKKFGDNIVLEDVSFSIDKGEVCCILGENGAGKSTLMKVLYGMYSADSGDIYFDGEKVFANSPQKAQKLGITMITQDSSLVPELTVSQNIFLNKELHYKHFPFINQALMDNKTKEIFDILQCNIDVRDSVSKLSFAQKQMVEIAKAVIFNSRMVIVDEPTSALMDSEVQRLGSVINKLLQMGVSIVYISHKLEEVRKIANKIVVMKHGKVVDVILQHEKLPSDYFIEKMANKDFLNKYPKLKCTNKEIVLRTENLSNTRRNLKNVNINIYSGEIVGLAGLQGSGKSSVAQMLCGLEKSTEGKLFVDGNEAPIRYPWDAKRYGISYISEYVSDNVFVEQNTAFNFTISSLKKFQKYVFLDNKKIKDTAKDYIEKLYLKIPYTGGAVKNMSQGTLQRLALSKLIYSAAKIVIMDEPSKDLDIPTRVGLYNIMSQLTRKGISILLISSDTEELIGMCNRIYIMLNGSVVKELNSEDATSAKILYYASGEND
jgi:ABC-type sugar transport system ATPase subunit